MGRTSRSRSSSRSSKRSHDREPSPDYTTCDYSGAYVYLKNHLLQDKSLMVAGSTAYVSSYSNTSQTVPLATSVHMEGLLTGYNVDHIYQNAPFFVREDGVYILFFISSDNEATQYSVFINGTLHPLATTGNNSGAGQLISRHMLNLKKDDSISIRNYLSDSGAITQSEYIGGFNKTSDTTFLLMKIAPSYEAVQQRNCEEKISLCKKEKILFKKVLGDMIYDEELMLKGFNTRGSFYSKTPQTINVENPVLFDLSLNVNNLELTGLSGEILIKEDGVYKVFFLINTSTAAQFGFFVNGVSVDPTIMGTNKGSGQLSSRALLNLNQGDVLSVLNHTSPNAVYAASNPGGSLAGVSTILTIFKVAPLIKAAVMPCAKEYCINYKAFRQYLLKKKHLQIDGAQAYLSVSSSTHQDIPVGNSVYFENNQLVPYRFSYRQGSYSFTVERDGIYDVFADVITNQPTQLTLFINNTPDNSTIFGRDSGGNRTIMRQIMKLKCGDIISVRNYQSTLGTVVTAQNPGGKYVGQNAMIMAFRLCSNKC